MNNALHSSLGSAGPSIQNLQQQQQQFVCVVCKRVEEI